MHADVEALLALQADDAEIHTLEQARAALAPRRAAMDQARLNLQDRLARAKVALEGDEKKMRELQERISEHRVIHEKNVATLDQVKRLREATAAMMQVERARRVLADEEGELVTMGRRLTEQRGALASLETAVAGLEQEQVAPRAELESELARISTEIAADTATRDVLAAKVPKLLLQPYNRVRTKRPGRAVVPLLVGSCGSCDTAVPMQRRSVMQTTGKVEICETCGVLMYAEG